MALLVLFHPALRRLYDKLHPINLADRTNLLMEPKPNSKIEIGKARLEQRASFDFVFGLIFLSALHGFSALKVVLILYINFSLATKLPRKYIPAATWIFNISTLFANELCNGYKFSTIERALSSSLGQNLTEEAFVSTWGAWLDGYSGIMSRWHILFNLTVLRLISFNLDYYWSLDRRSGSPLEV
jgi:hypothetical protein